MILYFDAFSGVSGDMLLGALLSVGAPVAALESAISALGLADECRLVTGRRDSCGISGMDVDIVPNERSGHEHRHYSEIAGMIENSALPEAVKQCAKAVFLKLGQAEASVHGVTLEEIAFHEVGALDSIADIVGCCALWHEIGCPKVICSPLALGFGSVKCAHGVLPVPAPATVELVRGVPVTPGEVPFELTTPTGAALITTLCKEFGPMPPMTVRTAGYGLGKRDTGRLNALRAVLGDEADALPDRGSCEEAVTLLEANLDDMTPEELTFAADMLLGGGALDVWTQPVVMKKGRAGMVLSCLTSAELAESLTDLYFKHTTTLGVRRAQLTRCKLERSELTVATEYGDVPVKTTSGTQKPEYDACARIAREMGVPLRSVRDAALNSYRRRQNEE